MPKTLTHRDHARQSVIRGIGLIGHGFILLEGQKANYRFSKEVIDKVEYHLAHIVGLVEEGKIINIPPEKRDAKFQSFMKNLVGELG